MRKLKKFTLAEGHALSSSEMAMLEGGAVFLMYCDSNTVGKPCAEVHGSIIVSGYCIKYSRWDEINQGNVYEYKCQLEQ